MKKTVMAFTFLIFTSPAFAGVEYDQLKVKFSQLAEPIAQEDLVGDYMGNCFASNFEREHTYAFILTGRKTTEATNTGAPIPTPVDRSLPCADHTNLGEHFRWNSS